MAISKDEIRNIANSFFSRRTPTDRANQCGRMNSVIEMELEDHPKVSTQPTRRVGEIEYDGTAAPHVFLTLPASEVKGVDAGPVIIDITVQQFCDENYEAGQVRLSLESVMTLPTDIGIYTPEDIDNKTGIAPFTLYNF